MQPYKLVATGSCMGVDPDRIIVKRILLTGIPIKIKRRNAVVKSMFWNPEDVKVRGRLSWVQCSVGYVSSSHLAPCVGVRSGSNPWSCGRSLARWATSPSRWARTGS